MESIAVEMNSLKVEDGRQEMNADGSYEERVKVDRKKFEQIINGENKEIGSAEDFFGKVMSETRTTITWPTKLKPGTKSKKDPHIRIVGNPENINYAKDKILDLLDSRKNRVTLKMDVAFTDHSHIIGKGGRSIQKVMNETGCHIHFPDSNRTNTVDKSNQVSIAGTAQGAEQARCRIRELLPLSVYFDVPISGYRADRFDHTSPPVQTIQQTYGLSISIRCSKNTNYGGFHLPYVGASATISVRGTRTQCVAMKQGIVCLIEYLLGNSWNPANVPIIFTLVIDIASQHHQFVMGRGNCNIRTITQQSGVNILFYDTSIENNPALTLNGLLSIRKSTVLIRGSCFDSVVYAWQELLGFLPLVLIFDLKEQQQTDAALITQLMKDFEVTILIKQKPKQNSGRCITVRGAERDSRSLFEVRRRILDLGEGEVPACCNKHTFMVMAKLFSSFLPQFGLGHGNIMAPKNGAVFNASGPLNIDPSIGYIPQTLPSLPSIPTVPDANLLQVMMAAQMASLVPQPFTPGNPNMQNSYDARESTMFGKPKDYSNNSAKDHSFSHPYGPLSNTPSMNGQSISPQMDSPESNGSITSAHSSLDLSPPSRSLSMVLSHLSGDKTDSQINLPSLWSDAKKLGYEERKFLAAKTIKENVKATEPRMPTSLWSGLGFSKSLPHEILKPSLDRSKAGLATVEESPNEPSESAYRCWENSQYQNGRAQPGTKFLKKQRSFDLSYSSGISSLGSLSSSSSLFSTNSESSGFNSAGKYGSDYGSPSRALDIVELLVASGCSDYADHFQGVDIDFNTFLTLTDADLEDLHIPRSGRIKIAGVINQCKLALLDQDSFGRFEAAPGAERRRRIRDN